MHENTSVREPLERAPSGDDPVIDATGVVRAPWLVEQQAVADGLVHLREYSIELLGDHVDDFERMLAAHVAAVDERLAGSDPEESSAAALLRVRADHRRFSESVEQLRWLLAIVRRENHGGNRQALGQYWRIALESLRLHLEWERPVVRSPEPSIPHGRSPERSESQRL